MQHVGPRLENDRQILETHASEHWFLKDDTYLANGLAHLRLPGPSCGQKLALKSPTQCQTKQELQLLLPLFLRTHKQLDPPCVVLFQQTLRVRPW